MQRFNPEIKQQPIESETEKEPYEKLKDYLREISNEINSEYTRDEERDILTSECQINMESFKSSNGEKGSYSDENIEQDIRESRYKEIEFSEADNEEKQKKAIARLMVQYKDRYGEKEGLERLKQEYGNMTFEEIVLEQEKKRNGSLLEMAKTCIFHKILKADFLVVRSAVHDDQLNGIDQFIIRKSDGAVVGAFDEVNDTTGKEDRDSRLDAKWQRAQKKAQRGGAWAKYGITFEKGTSGKNELIKRNLKNLPLFYLAISTPELRDLLGNMNYDIDGEISQTELNVFNKLTDSLEEQANSLLQNEEIQGVIRDNLNNFTHSLEEIKQFGK